MAICIILTFQVHTTAHIFAHTLIIIVMIVGRSAISFVFHVDNKALFMCYLLNTQIFLDSFIISAFLVSIIIIYGPARNGNHVNITYDSHIIYKYAWGKWNRPQSIAVQNFLRINFICEIANVHWHNLLELRSNAEMVR